MPQNRTNSDRPDYFGSVVRPQTANFDINQNRIIRLILLKLYWIPAWNSIRSMLIGMLGVRSRISISTVPFVSPTTNYLRTFHLKLPFLPKLSIYSITNAFRGIQILPIYKVSWCTRSRATWNKSKRQFRCKYTKTNISQ